MSSLVFEELTVGVGRKILHRNLNGRINQGEWVHLTGSNGIGKTTLLHVLASFRRARGGTLRWGGQPVDRSPGRLRSELRFSGHERGLMDELTVRENWELLSRLFPVQFPPPYLDSLPSNCPVKSLSQGQRCQLELASMFAAPRSMNFFDEPLVSLDDQRIKVAYENLHRLSSEQAIITASTDVLNQADRCLKLTQRGLNHL